MSGGDERGNVTIVVDVQVRNDGSPSTLTDWQLLVRTPKNRYEAFWIPIDKDVELRGRDGKVNGRIVAASDLSRQIGNQNLSKGGGVHGQLQFIVKDATKPDILDKSTLLMIQARDSGGRIASMAPITIGALSAIATSN